MGTIADKLNLLQNTKENIRYAIMAMGLEVPEEEPFSTYPEYIMALPSGGELPDGVSELTVENGMPDMGSVSQGGYVSDGVRVTVEAAPKDGYRFTSWAKYQGSSKFPSVVEAQTYTFTMAGNVRFKARFEAV